MIPRSRGKRRLGSYVSGFLGSTVVVVLGLFIASAGALADTGSTPAAAAQSRAVRYAARQARGIEAGLTYSVAPCTLLHKRPWVAYKCRYVINPGRRKGDTPICDTLVVAVKRISNGLYSAQAKKLLDTPGSCRPAQSAG